MSYYPRYKIWVLGAPHLDFEMWVMKNLDLRSRPPRPKPLSSPIERKPHKISIFPDAFEFPPTAILNLRIKIPKGAAYKLRPFHWNPQKSLKPFEFNELQRYKLKPFRMNEVAKPAEGKIKVTRCKPTPDPATRPQSIL